MSDSMAIVADLDFDRRWKVWQERGRANELVNRRRLQVVLPAIAFIALAFATGLLLAWF